MLSNTRSIHRPEAQRDAPLLTIERRPGREPPISSRPGPRIEVTVPTEAVVRRALRERVLADTPGERHAVDEFWVPRSHERADIAVIGHLLDGFEIKTERDTLGRLPRQADAYARVFDRCTAVVAGRHRAGATEILPEWWGVVEISVNGKVSFAETRAAGPNPDVDPETLVRLLWREEAFAALMRLGAEPSPRSTRSTLWTELLRLVDAAQLRCVVRHALHMRARTPVVSRFMPRSVGVADR